MDLWSIIAANSWLLFIAVTLLGLVVGSFLNVVILRYPAILKYEWEQECAEYSGRDFNQEKPPGLVVSRSHCPQCKTQLKAWHNIPVLSYLLLGGRCGFCRKSIPFRYPLVESISGALALLLAVKFGFGWQLLAGLVLLWVLTCITWIDIDTFLIPDQLSLGLLWLGLFVGLFELFIPLREAVVGALVGYLSLWLIFWLFKLLTGKEGMGYGDFKLLAAGGAWLGAEMLLPVLVLASVSGLVVSVILRKNNKVPFGPYLSVGIFASLLWGEQLLRWYLP